MATSCAPHQEGICTYVCICIHPIHVLALRVCHSHEQCSSPGGKVVVPVKLWDFQRGHGPKRRGRGGQLVWEGQPEEPQKRAANGAKEHAWYTCSAWVLFWAAGIPRCHQEQSSGFVQTLAGHGWRQGQCKNLYMHRSGSTTLILDLIALHYYAYTTTMLTLLLCLC